MRFEFISERPVLDFVATLAERGHANLEQLRTAEHLEDWITQSGLLDDVSVTDADLERARELRDATFRLIRALIDHTGATSTDRALVNAAAAQPLPRLHLGADGVRRTGDATGVLAVLARDCVDLHDSPDRHLLRWCSDAHCTRPFIDRSHGSRRRWCGMRGCGDRAKAAAYRQRRRTALSSQT